MTGETATTRQTDDVRWMRRALAVAETARGHTRPNPFVGAVVVADDHEVAAGATGPAGTAHAEIRALEAAGASASGATLVVTLEPCAHVGRTPPCTAAIVAAGIRRVVVGLRDPNPIAAGGVDRLRDAGIEVVTGVLADEVASQQVEFLTTVLHGRPHVTLKLAQRRDGTTRPDDTGRRWITGPVARRRVHELRATVDAVLVGSGTVLADDPDLTVRDAVPGPVVPRAVVVDRRGRLPTDRRVVRPGTIVLTGAGSKPDWRRGLARRDVEVAVAEDLASGLATLARLGISAVLAEPGTTLATALVDADLADRVLLHVAGTRVDDDRAWTPAVPVDGLQAVARRRLGDDVEWDWQRPVPVAAGPSSRGATGSTRTPAPSRHEPSDLHRVGSPHGPSPVPDRS